MHAIKNREIRFVESPHDVIETLWWCMQIVMHQRTHARMAIILSAEPPKVSYVLKCRTIFPNQALLLLQLALLYKLWISYVPSFTPLFHLSIHSPNIIHRNLCILPESARTNMYDFVAQTMPHTYITTMYLLKNITTNISHVGSVPKVGVMLTMISCVPWTYPHSLKGGNYTQNVSPSFKGLLTFLMHHYCTSLALIMSQDTHILSHPYTISGSHKTFSTLLFSHML